MVFKRIGLIDKNRIIPPDYPFRADHIRQLLKSRYDNIVFRWNSRFDVMPVSIQCELEVVGIIGQSIQLVQYGYRILGPEYNTVNKFRI